LLLRAVEIRQKERRIEYREPGVFLFVDAFEKRKIGVDSASRRLNKNGEILLDNAFCEEVE
jgi:hypothetical protein